MQVSARRCEVNKKKLNEASDPSTPVTDGYIFR